MNNIHVAVLANESKKKFFFFRYPTMEELGNAVFGYLIAGYVYDYFTGTTESELDEWVDDRSQLARARGYTGGKLLEINF